MAIVRMPDGTQVDFGDLPPEQIRSLIQQKFPAETQAATTPAAAPKPAVTPFGSAAASTGKMVADPMPETEADRRYAAMSLPEKIGHTGAVLSQAGLRGVADLAGAPVDLPVGLFNLTQLGLNKAGSSLFGLPEVDSYIPFSLSDTIANAASAATESATGFKPFGEEDMTARENFLYDPVRFATGAGAAGGALAAGGRALKTGAETGKQLPTSIADAFTRPYVSNPGRTIAGDTASGFGAGVGSDIAEEQFPDSPTAQLVAMLLGGIGGSAAVEVGHFAGRTARDLTRGYADVPLDPATTQPVKASEFNQAARVAQAFTTDPMTGVSGAAPTADEIGRAATEFRTQGLPVPSTGTISGSRGLMELEGRQRTQNNRVFREKDEEIKAAGSERINQIRDPNADQSLVRSAVPARRSELASARDADALPYLQRAETSGAVVDAQPVVDLIDAKLKTAKRDPVINALSAVRKKLNAPGTENLDTSVAGLYETRKAINDIIEGRSDNSTGRFAKKELIEVKAALDDAITAADPEFGTYLTKFREGSEPLDVFRDSAATQQLIERDPRSVAKAILEEDYGASERFDEVAQLIGNKPETKRAWKAAVADAVTDKITGPTKLDDSENFAVEVAKAERFFKKHRDDLTKVFDPDEMNAMQQGMTLLSTLKNAGMKSAAGGPNTADKLAGFYRTAEVALKARYGVLKGGGIMRTLRLAAASLPNSQAAVERLLLRAAFDPELMQDLLNAKLRNLDYYSSNRWLRTTIAGKGAADEIIDEDQEE